MSYFDELNKKTTINKKKKKGNKEATATQSAVDPQHENIHEIINDRLRRNISANWLPPKSS
jgi:hypothetical protein